VELPEKGAFHNMISKRTYRPRTGQNLSAQVRLQPTPIDHNRVDAGKPHLSQRFKRDVVHETTGATGFAQN